MGHKISGNSFLQVDQEKVDKITSFPPPITVKRVKSFLGLSRFYQRFIKDFAKVANPMYKLQEKNFAFVFDVAYMNSFEAIKKKLI